MLPDNENFNDFLQVLLLYFESRCVYGFVPSIGIQTTRNNKKLDPQSSWNTYSSLKMYFDDHGYIGRKNPMDHPVFVKYANGFKGLIKETQAAKGQTGSRPFYYEHMEMFYKKVFELNPTEIALRFMAIAAVCYVCFFRISECLSLKFKNISFYTYPNGKTEWQIKLDHRKTDVATATTPENPFTYRIINNPSEPACNAYYFLFMYFDYLKKHDLINNPEEYVFGHVYKGKLKYDGKSQSTQVFNNFLKTLIEALELDFTLFSSHAFRKGGVRHRHLYALYRWSIETIIRWACWAEPDVNKSSRILYTYLQDEAKMKENDRAEHAMNYAVLQPTYEEMHTKQMVVLLSIQCQIQSVSVIINSCRLMSQRLKKDNCCQSNRCSLNLSLAILLQFKEKK